LKNILKIFREDLQRFIELDKQEKLGQMGGEIILSITNGDDYIKVYNILNENGAKYYGNGTKWCTSADKNNMFDHYKRFGNIYMIQIKKADFDPKKTKYQLHVEVEQLSNSEDIKVSFKDIYDLAESIDKTKEFINWIYKLFYNENTKTLTYGFFDIHPIKIPENILNEVEHLIFNDNFNQPLGNLLDKLINLKEIVFGREFNQPLGDSLDKLTKLEIVKFTR